MVKIVQISDIHWRGSQRHEEYTQAFEMLFEKIKQIKPDIIINTGDIYHTKTVAITPEVIGKLAWMFESLGNLCPSYTMLGNHDGNLTNLTREDVITPIHNAVNHPNNHLMKQSGIYPLNEKVNLCVFSPFDKKNWDSVRPEDGKINIALYHGSISGCLTDTDFVMSHGEAEVKFFEGFSFVLMGDIHKQQTIAKRTDKNGIYKPYIAYPGSLIQQNHGETEEKGFLVWDIRSGDDWDVEFHPLENLCPFYTADWQGSVVETINEIEKERGEKAFLKGSRVRIRTTTSISKLEHANIVHELKRRGVAEATVKYDFTTHVDNIQTKNLSFSKKKLSSDPDLIIKLFEDYLQTHKKTYPLNSSQEDIAKKSIRRYVHQLQAEKQQISESNHWSIKSLEFDNLFRYGEGNYIDFGNMDGLCGIFGPNRLGKSSVVGAIMYALFNTTDRGGMKSAYIINKNKSYCSAKIRITVGGIDWVIERETERTIPKKKKNYDETKTATKVNLWKVSLDASGEEVLENQNCDSRDETDKKIRKLLGTSEDFMLTAFAGQGDVNRFLEQGATQRKQALSRILELDIFDKLYSYAREEYTSLNNKSKFLQENNWAEKAKEVSEEIEEIKKNLALTEQTLSSLKDKQSILLKEVQNYESKNSLENPERLENLQNLLNRSKKEIDSNNAKISNFKDNLKTLKEEKTALLEKSKIDPVELQKQISKQKDLERQFVALANNLKIEENTLNNQIKSIRKLDTVPCGDSFPNCKFIRDSHEDKSNHEKQKEIVSNLKKQNENLKNIVDAFSVNNIEQKLNEYNNAKNRLHQVNDDLYKFEKHIEKLSFENEKLSYTIETKSKEASIIKESLEHCGEAEYKENLFRLKKENSSIRTLEETKNKLHQSLGGKQIELKNYKDKAKQTKELLKELKVFDAVQSAFSKMGIPAIVLEMQLPIINNEVKKILEGIVNFSVSLHTDSSSNVMDVYIEDSNSKRIVELCSGMEKSMISIALRAALVNLSSLSRPDIFILDESYGALDEDNLQAAIQLLTSLKNHFRTILTISHIAEIKDCVDIMLEVQDLGNESKIFWPNQ